MKILDFSTIQSTGNLTYDILLALRKCKTEKYQKLVFPKDDYVIDTTYCEERYLCVSNHDLNDAKRIAVLIEDMENFEIDFNGSTITTKGIITPIVVRNSKNITVKNVFLRNPSTMMLQTRVVETGEDWAKLKIEYGEEDFIFDRGTLYSQCGREYIYALQDASLEFDGITGEVAHGSGGNPLGNHRQHYHEKTNDGHIIVHGISRKPPIGNYVVLHNYHRAGSGVFAENSENLYFENLIINSCYGMGMLVQFCRNVTLNKCGTKRRDGRIYTAAADGTHFVGCTGVVTLENCEFEGQFDDALNIHGVYLRVVGRISNNELLIKEMHHQALNLPVLNAGDLVQVLDPESLIPYTQRTVEWVEFINSEILKVKFKEPVTDINIGDDIESLTQVCDLIFRNNIVRDNRARGILIAAKGKVLVENNYFHSSGVAILFEAEDSWWFESGGTTDVTLKNNVFDNCRHGGEYWCEPVIFFKNRRKTEKDKYFHGEVKIIDNEFKMYNDEVLEFANIEKVVFTGNKIDKDNVKITIAHCGESKLQDGKINYIFKD